jgi:hypothetical protein
MTLIIESHFLVSYHIFLFILSHYFIFLDPYASHYQQQLCSSHCSMHSYNNQAIPPLPLPLAQPQQNPYYHYAQPCTLHSQNTYSTPVMPPVPVIPASSSPSSSLSNNCFQHHLPHSKSLDQYDGANKIHANGVNQHRLSLDSHNYNKIPPPPPPHHLSPSQLQSQHGSGASTFDYMDPAFNHHPYNQPNVRAPLPYNLSSNLGNHFSNQDGNGTGYYASNNEHHHIRNDYYQQPMMQLPMPVNDYCQQHHPPPPQMDFKPPPEVKLRSSLKKSTPHSTSDSLDMEAELNELRALKREKSSTPASTSSEMKTRDGIGNYQTWDYVFQNLEKEVVEKKKTITADEKIAAELESLKITVNGHGPPRDRHAKPIKNGVQTSNQTKMRTKSVSTSTDLSPMHPHEHKRTSSVSTESNHKIQMPKLPELVVGKDEWSCRFCTFLNPNTKKICEMCSKSKDFFLDADKSSVAAATATCV